MIFKERPEGGGKLETIFLKKGCVLYKCTMTPNLQYNDLIWRFYFVFGLQNSSLNKF